MEYFEWVGKQFGNEFAGSLTNYQGRRLELKKGMAAIHAYELELGRALLSALGSIPGLRLYGLTDENRLQDRVATFSFRLEICLHDWLLKSWLMKAFTFGMGTIMR